MSLDPDAQAIADLAASIPPFHTMSIEGAREIAAMAAMPPMTDIAQVTERAVPTEHGTVPVRVYHPAPTSVLPLLIYMHGGGWSTGGLYTADETCRILATTSECVVVSVDYRLAPEHKFPAAFHDVYGVAQWLTAHADQVGGDGDRIAIGGDSAGANLAAAVCLHARDHEGPKFVLQLLAYPATEFGVPRASLVENAHAPMLWAQDVTWFWDHYLDTEADRSDARAVPSAAASLAGLPPAVVITAQYDPIRDDGEAYAQALADAGVAVTSTRYPGVFHGFFTIPILTRTQQALSDTAACLRNAFSTAAAIDHV